MLGLRRRTATAEAEHVPPASIEADLAGATVSGQVAIGEHIVQIQAGPGAKVTYVAPDARPVLRLRPIPIARLPRDFPGLLGRESELAAVASALDAGQPVEVSGAAGIGKTALLRRLAHRAAAVAPEGIVFTACGRQPVDDVLQFLVESLYESDMVFVPTPAQLREHLSQRRVLVVLDDVGLSREELGQILDSVPQCLVVGAATTRLLWGEGRELSLLGLAPAAALELMERELGRALAPAERATAEAFCRDVGGHPLRVLQAAALMREPATGAPPASARELEGELARSLSARDRAVLGPLVAVPGAPLDADRVGDAAGIADAAQALASLERRGLAQSHSPRFTLARAPPPIVLEEAAAQAWRERTLAAYAADPGGLRFPEDSGAVVALLDAGARAERWGDVLRLARGADAAATAGGRVGTWGGLVDHALTAARALGDPAAEAWALHQQGSRAMCLGDRAFALEALEGALELRERLGDAEGAATTRHNLAQLGGGAGPPSHNGQRPPPRPRWPWVAGGVLAVVAAGVVAAVLAAGGGSTNQGAPAPNDSAAAPGTHSAPAAAAGGAQGSGPTKPIANPGGATPQPQPVPATVTPRRLQFDVQALKTHSDPQSIDVANDSPTAVSIGGVSTAGENPGDFTVDATQCADRTLAPQTPCMVSVTFAPTADGARTATVTFADLGDGSSKSVELVGTGTEPARSAGTSVPETTSTEGTTSTPTGKQTPTEADNG